MKVKIKTSRVALSPFLPGDLHAGQEFWHLTDDRFGLCNALVYTSNLAVANADGSTRLRAGRIQI